MAKDTPNKPQVHYLLGQIYAEEGEAKLALASFEKAVQLDPRYFNAWKQIVALAEQGSSTAAELNEAALTVLRLDPMTLHGGYISTGRIDDYAALWGIFADAYASLPPTPKGPLYPLRERPRDGMDFGGMRLMRESGAAASGLRKGPGGGFLSIGEISDICSLRFVR